MKLFQDDFLLRHYDSGECQGKLGHSRLSVILHRTQVSVTLRSSTAINMKKCTTIPESCSLNIIVIQVIGIFAGFAVLLLVASPLLLIAAPCLICCKCRLDFQNYCIKTFFLNTQNFRTCVKTNEGAARKLEFATQAAKQSSMKQ